MNEERNGSPAAKKQLPVLAIGWDAETQTVHPQFNPEDFRRWEFIVAVLDMAKAWAEKNKRLTEFQEIQRLEKEQAQATAIRRSLGR